MNLGGIGESLCERIGLLRDLGYDIEIFRIGTKALALGVGATVRNEFPKNIQSLPRYERKYAIC